MGWPSFQLRLYCGAVFVALVLLGLAGEAAARCSEKADFDLLEAGLSSELRCRTSALLGDGSACSGPTYPACAGSMPQRVVETIHGSGAGGVAAWSTEMRRCQRRLALGSQRFVAERLQERAAGRRRARASRAMVLAAESGCERAVVESDALGGKLPRVGAACAGLLGEVGEAIDARRLARCMRATLEGEIDDIAPWPLRPSIVLILTDDQRVDFVDAMPRVRTLREDGIHFRNAFTTNPVCTPSRASVLTGRYTHNNGVLSNGHFLFLDDSDTIATWLAAAGYTNGLFGKYLNNTEVLGPTPPQGWHEWKSFLHPGGGEFYGFRVNDNGTYRRYSQNTYSTDWMRSRLLRFVRQNSEDPFFAVFSPFAPHGPAAAARRHRAEFLDTAPHRPPSYFGDLEGKPDWVKYYQAIAGPDLAEETDTMHIARLQSLLSVDEAVELILEKLEKLGLRDNTVVVFTSDHGFLLGEHWLRGKFNAYEESIRIPLIVQYPRRFPLPGIRDQMVLNHDLAPTLGEFAQAVVPADLDGVSMVPVLHSPNAPWRQHFLIETLGEFITAPSESVRTERWKYIETVAKAGVTEELYDLFVDPYEMTNLADDPSYVWVLADMDARLDLLRGP